VLRQKPAQGVEVVAFSGNAVKEAETRFPRPVRGRFDRFQPRKGHEVEPVLMAVVDHARARLLREARFFIPAKEQPRRVAVPPDRAFEAKQVRARQAAKKRIPYQVVRKRLFVYRPTLRLEKVIFRNPAAAVDIARKEAVADLRQPRLIHDVSVAGVCGFFRRFHAQYTALNTA